jgi:MFS-type transporter involved in bile tolerance (Atg22 family)
MYDFANTIFAMNVVSLYFALWVTIDKQGKDIFYSIALSFSMLLAAFILLLFLILGLLILGRVPCPKKPAH